MRGTSAVSLLVGAAVCAGGCLGVGAAPRTHHYVLQSPPPPARGAVGEVRLGVATLEVDAPYDQDRLVYRVSSGGSEVGFYNYHRWAAPLGRLMASSLATAVRGCAEVASAEPLTPGADYDAVLSGRVVRLEEIEYPDRSEARVELDLTLESRAGTVLWRGTIAGRSSGRAVDGGDAMELIQLAFGEVVGQLRETVSAALQPGAGGSR